MKQERRSSTDGLSQGGHGHHHQTAGPYKRGDKRKRTMRWLKELTHRKRRLHYSSTLPPYPIPFILARHYIAQHSAARVLPRANRGDFQTAVGSPKGCGCPSRPKMLGDKAGSDPTAAAVGQVYQRVVVRAGLKEFYPLQRRRCRTHPAIVLY